MAATDELLGSLVEKTQYLPDHAPRLLRREAAGSSEVADQLVELSRIRHARGSVAFEDVRCNSFARVRAEI
jgi:hypothetical protein